MSENTNTTSVDSNNGYLKDLRTHEDVPMINGAALKNELIEKYNKVGDIFLDEDGTVTSSGEIIQEGEIVLLVGTLPIKELNAKRDLMKKNEKIARDAIENRGNEDKDRNNDGIDDRNQ
ncbi:MAG: hypothetical protein IJ867_00840 [Clostridia bacterium]|nr:hypothetical protein [Clostridia bacterium]